MDFLYNLKCASVCMHICIFVYMKFLQSNLTYPTRADSMYGYVLAWSLCTVCMHTCVNLCTVCILLLVNWQLSCHNILGLGQFAFNDLRYDSDGQERPDFVLNQPTYRKSSIIIAADNFGCGSSRVRTVSCIHVCMYVCMYLFIFEC